MENSVAAVRPASFAVKVASVPSAVIIVTVSLFVKPSSWPTVIVAVAFALP